MLAIEYGGFIDDQGEILGADLPTRARVEDAPESGWLHVNYEHVYRAHVVGAESIHGCGGLMN